jgi:MFS family permease
MLAGAAPAFLTFFIRIFVPESDRWKAAVKKGPSKPLQEIFSAALWRRTVLAIAFASIALIGTWGSVQWLPLWADEMAGATLPKAKAYTQATSAIGAVIGCLVGAWVGEKVGRRSAYFLLCFLSLLSCGWLFRTTDAYGTRFLFQVLLVGGVTAAFYGWLPLYLPELFPTRVRATAQGLSFNFGRILAAVGALQMADLMAFYGGSFARAGATLTLVYALGLFLIWLAPETRGKPLPE